MLKLADKLHVPVSAVINRRTSLFKIEDVGYMSAFLTSLRQKLLPYHSKSLKNYPEKSEIDKCFKELYKELNELYTDEHWTMGNNDFLEQSYDIFSNIHKLVRKYEVVYDLKLEENKRKFRNNDPDQFPVYNLTGNNNEPDYKTIWELRKDFAEEFEENMGFNLVTKRSKIEHPDSGNGVFLSCKKRRFILPGTLLGFYPGIIYLKNPPPVEINAPFPYLKRPDGVWIDPSGMVPYPYKYGMSLTEFLNDERLAIELSGIKEILYKLVPIRFLNPLAQGHLINHPPPDIATNVKLIDIDIPFKFFPNDFLRYLPNIREFKSSKKTSEYFNHLRTVGVVSLTEINDKDELYADYIEEDMVPDTYRPDWLLEPPPRNPYLIKREYFQKRNLLDDFIYKAYLNIYGKENLEFKKFIKREEGLDLIRANANIKSIQAEIREQNKLTEQSSTDDKQKKMIT